jgi:UDPglucose 6-dehydrogenase
VAKNVREGRLSFATELTDAVRQRRGRVHRGRHAVAARRRHADLSYVYQAAREIAAAMDGYTVVVTKSTVPVGTGDEVERIIRRAARGRVRGGVEPGVPARGRGHRRLQAPGPHRASAPRTSARRRDARALPAALPQPGPDAVTSRRTAELTKYAANAFLATKITFINEIADLCEKVGANVQESRAASASTTASARSSCTRARATAARASRRTRWR